MYPLQYKVETLLSNECLTENSNQETEPFNDFQEY